MRNVYVALCLMFFLVENSSCVLKEVWMKEETVYFLYKVEENCENIKLSLYHGLVERRENCLFKITFFEAHGGESLLFGKVVRDLKPQTQNTVEVYRNDTLLRKISYFDILKLPSQQTDSINIYIFE